MIIPFVAIKLVFNLIVIFSAALLPSSSRNASSISAKKTPRNSYNRPIKNEIDRRLQNHEILQLQSNKYCFFLYAGQSMHSPSLNRAIVCGCDRRFDAQVVLPVYRGCSAVVLTLHQLQLMQAVAVEGTNDRATHLGVHWHPHTMESRLPYKVPYTII